MIAVVELQVDGAFAQIGGRFVFLLHQRKAQAEVREARGGLRRVEGRRFVGSVDLQKGGQCLEVFSTIGHQYRFVDASHKTGHQINSRERRRRTNFSMLSRSSSLTATKCRPYFAMLPTNSARRTSASICIGFCSPGR